jgi:sugar lactone lactonase YvrE
VNGDRLYRAPTRALVDPSHTPGALGALVEDWTEKTISDGLTTDDAGRIYMTDPEHSAIHVIRPDGSLETLVRDARLRWPDGLSFGPDGWLYVTCSALHQVLFRPETAVAEHAPYQIFRIRPGGTATPGQ